MRLYRIVTRAGANIDIQARSVLDDPSYDVIYFFRDEFQQQLAATLKRVEFAGLIIHPEKPNATVPLPNPL
jgi:hypothetical protein